LVQLCFIKRNGQRRYTYLVLGRVRYYFVKKIHSDSTKKFSETDIINMLEFFIDNIFVIFGGCVFQQTVSITHWYKLCFSSRRLVPLFLWGRFYTGQGLLKKNEMKLTQSFNFTFRYIDDVPSLDNSRFGDFVHRIYPIEHGIKDTTDTDRSA